MARSDLFVVAKKKITCVMMTVLPAFLNHHVSLCIGRHTIYLHPVSLSLSFVRVYLECWRVRSGRQRQLSDGGESPSTQMVAKLPPNPNNQRNGLCLSPS